MKRMIGKLMVLVLTATAVLSMITISACAKDDKSVKTDKKASVTAPSAIPAAPENGCAWEGIISRAQARQTALDDAQLNWEALKYLVCYVSWTDHVPTAYEVKFATRWAAFHYTIDLDTGAILDSVCYPRR